MFPLLDDFGPCSLCGASSWRPLLTLHKSKGELALIGCASCGIARRQPLPTEAELAAYYESAAGWDADKPAPASPKYGKALKAKHESYAPVADRLEPMLRPSGGAEQPRILDFGCGLGAFLDLFAARGWRTCGLEPGPISRQVAAARHELVDEVPSTPGFEAVLVHHVLEHLRDPVEAVRSLARATVPGGRIFVQVPSLEELPEHGKLGYVCGGVHIHSYSRVGLQSLLLAAGYDEVELLDAQEWRSVGRGPLASRAVGTRTEADPWACTAPAQAGALDPLVGALREYETRYSRGRPDILRGRNAGWQLRQQEQESLQRRVASRTARILRRQKPKPY